MERYRCPFYGMAGIGKAKMFIEQETGMCAMTLEKSSMCLMETAGRTPNWDFCAHFNHPGNKMWIDRILDGFTVFSDRMKPEGGNLGKGVPAREWVERMTKKSLKEVTDV